MNRLGFVRATFATLSGARSRGDGAVDRGRNSAFHIDFEGRTEDAIDGDAVGEVDALDLDDETQRVDNDRQFTDVTEQTVVSRFTARGVMGNHAPIVPVVSEVEFAFRVVRDGRPHDDLVAHAVEGRGHELDLDTVRQNEDVLHAVTDVTSIILAHVIVDVRHTDDVAEDLDAGDTLEGSSRGSTKLLLEEGLLQDAAGSSRQHGDGFLLDIASTVSITQRLEVSQIQISDEDRRTDLVASDVVGANVLRTIDRVRGVRKTDTIVHIFDGTDAEFESDFVLTEADDLGEVGGVLFRIDLTDRVIEHIVPPDRNIEGERNTVGHDRDAGLAEVLFREPGIELVTNQRNRAGGHQGVRESTEVRVVGVVTNTDADISEAVGDTPLQGDGRLDVEIQNERFVVSEVGEDTGSGAVGHHRTLAEVRTELDVRITHRRVVGVDHTGQPVLADRNFAVEVLRFALVVGKSDTDELDLDVVGDQVGAVDVAVAVFVLDRGELEQVGLRTELERAIRVDELEFRVVAGVDFDQLQLVASEGRIRVQVDETLAVLGVAGEIVDFQPLLGVGDVRLSRGTGRHDTRDQTDMEVHDGDRDGNLHIRNSHVDVRTERFHSSHSGAVEDAGDVRAVERGERTSFRLSGRGVIRTHVLHLPSSSRTLGATVHDVENALAALLRVGGVDTARKNEILQTIDTLRVHRGFEAHGFVADTHVLISATLDQVARREVLPDFIVDTTAGGSQIARLHVGVVRESHVKLLEIFVNSSRHCQLSLFFLMVSSLGNLMIEFSKLHKLSTERRLIQYAFTRFRNSTF